MTGHRQCDAKHHIDAYRMVKVWTCGVMYDTVWIQSNTYCISCISPRSRYSEIQYILYLLYLGPDTVDTACISPWSRYGGYVSYM